MKTCFLNMKPDKTLRPSPWFSAFAIPLCVPRVLSSWLGWDWGWGCDWPHVCFEEIHVICYQSKYISSVVKIFINGNLTYKKVAGGSRGPGVLCNAQSPHEWFPSTTSSVHLSCSNHQNLFSLLLFNLPGMYLHFSCHTTFTPFILTKSWTTWGKGSLISVWTWPSVFMKF